mmetsp:Transcript_16399/g.18541  ORF Transcript_16399/g.18541 Transcript_16399/m.18541 type:complete len:153 (+) Transcript_16399:82-540(+)
MVTGVKTRAPVLGGNFAVWGLMFSSIDCTLAALRRKEDPWNSIMAGAATGGLLVARGGRKAMMRQAAVGGILLGLIEGLNIFISQQLAGAEDQQVGMQVATPPPVSTILSGTAGQDASGLADAASQGFNLNKASGNIYDDPGFGSPAANKFS